ncbi:protein FAM184A-like isoform X2 [Cylas formicarius]|uniref:protein FAM184A-like isoform X2 n=1 Tax=Cylas formicarius TaxID=197179 RepID=UPI0029584EC4|nr:protein FAM184A-like isoform X2 [Cylas formicarius]
MFNFFRKSKKDEGGSRKGKDKEADATPVQKKIKDRENSERSSPTDVKKNMCKNNQPSTPELAPESDSVSLPKNVVNASKTISSEVETFYEKNERENMCDTYVNGLKVADNKSSERRSSSGGGVKPCGHGTTAILPKVPLSGVSQKLATPPESPVMEIKKTFKYTVNGIQEEPNQLEKVEESGSPEVVPNLDRSLSKKIEDKEKNLINQEAKFQSQLNDLSKQLSVRDAEANKLRFEMEELQRDVFAKSAGMDRLQSELNAANKESDAIRQKIRHLENELETYRIRNNELADDLKNKTEIYNNYEYETKSKISELEGVISNLRVRIQNLEDQIKQLQEEKEDLERRHAELQSERQEEQKKLSETVDGAVKQKEEIEKKWKEDFEKLRTINILKEQELLDDFEWKLREVQLTCKKKLDDKDKAIEERLQEAYKEAQRKMTEAEDMLTQVESLKSYELEVQKLRGRTFEQEKNLKEMREQQQQMMQAEANLKNETKRLLNLIEIEKENLQHIQRIHRQELLDKERKLKETLNQKRTEIAMYWEERLLHECGRLKDELEQIHNEEKYKAMESVRKQKDEEFQKKQNEWEKKLRQCLKEIESLKKSLDEKDEYYHEELIRVRSNTDRDIMELRRLMDKIDMAHHNNYEKLVEQHDSELEKLNLEHEDQIREIETMWQNKMSSLSSTLDAVKEQMEKESEQKIESLIQQHRNELDSQWGNLIHQKSEAIKLVENEYVSKYNTLEEQFYTQQKSHTAREIELLKTIDSLKNELQSKESTLDDLQNNVDTLEGGVQVLNNEIAQQAETMTKMKNETDQKIRCTKPDLPCIVFIFPLILYFISRSILQTLTFIAVALLFIVCQNYT